MNVSTWGDEAVTVWKSLVGSREWPDGSNMDLNGPISALQRRNGVPGAAWCGSFMKDAYDRIGFEAGVQLADPSTWRIFEKARAAGAIKKTPVRGCMALIRPGAHGHVTGYVGPGPRRGTFESIGGNEGNAVRHTAARSTAGFMWVVPEGLEKSRYRIVSWYRWEDPQARQWVRWFSGPGAMQAREKWMAAWAKANPGKAGHMRKLSRNTKRGMQYGVQIGPDRYGSWTKSKAERNRQAANIERTRGRKVRRISEKRIVKD